MIRDPRTGREWGTAAQLAARLGPDITVSDDLVTWLRAQLDEDERVAQAEVDAKRRILDLHADPHECPEWDRLLGETCTGLYGAEGCPTLRLLALPYADRPGYREDWRP